MWAMRASIFTHTERHRCLIVFPGTTAVSRLFELIVMPQLLSYVRAPFFSAWRQRVFPTPSCVGHYSIT